MHVQLPQQHRTGALHTLNGLAILRRDTALEYTTGGGGRDPGCIEQILERDGNAVQRSSPVAALDLRFGGTRLC